MLPLIFINSGHFILLSFQTRRFGTWLALLDAFRCTLLHHLRLQYLLIPFDIFISLLLFELHLLLHQFSGIGFVIGVYMISGTYFLRYWFWHCFDKIWVCIAFHLLWSFCCFNRWWLCQLLVFIFRDVAWWLLRNRWSSLIWWFVTSGTESYLAWALDSYTLCFTYLCCHEVVFIRSFICHHIFTVVILALLGELRHRVLSCFGAVSCICSRSTLSLVLVWFDIVHHSRTRLALALDWCKMCLYISTAVLLVPHHLRIPHFSTQCSSGSHRACPHAGALTFLADNLLIYRVKIRSTYLLGINRSSCGHLLSIHIRSHLVLLHLQILYLLYFLLLGRRLWPSFRISSNAHVILFQNFIICIEINIIWPTRIRRFAVGGRLSGSFILDSIGSWAVGGSGVRRHVWNLSVFLFVVFLLLFFVILGILEIQLVVLQACAMVAL